MTTGEAARADDGRGKPNPGSSDALGMGCLCPVLDNGHGRRAPFAPDSWWITQGCPVHAPEAAR